MRTLARLLLCSVVVAAFAASPALASPARPQEAFTITEYVVNVQVSESNEYSVDESIAVRFTQPQHGIYRDIPMGNGAKLEFLDVEGYAYSLEPTGSSLRVKIGDAGTTVEGEQVYKLHYRYLPGGGESSGFYYNLIGTLWDTVIDNASFTVTLPKPFDEAKLGFSVGPAGSSGYAPEDLAYEVRGGTVTGRALRPLEAYEGLTMRLELPQGYFADTGAQPEPELPAKEPLPAGPDAGVSEGGGLPAPRDEGLPAQGIAAGLVLPGALLAFLAFCCVAGVIVVISVVAAVNRGRTPGLGRYDPGMQNLQEMERMREHQRFMDQSNFNPPPPPPPPPSDPPSSGGGGGGSW